MSRKFKFHQTDGCYFITVTVVDWVDVFTRNNYREIITSSIGHCQEHKGLIVHAWVLMTNHLHMIISSGANGLLADIMRDFKSYTSRALRKEIIAFTAESRQPWLMHRFNRAGLHNSNNNDYQLWQQGNHPVLLKDAGMIKRALEYIHQNPVTAGFVSEPHHWLWSSAADYAGMKGMVEVVLLDV